MSEQLKRAASEVTASSEPRIAMFNSKAFLWKKGAILARVWIAANLAQCKSFRVKLSRRDYCSTDVEKACEILLSQVGLTIRLSSHLMLGVVRIHNRQTDYILQDFEALLKQFDYLAKKSSNKTAKKQRRVMLTLPECSFDCSFSSLRDFDPTSQIHQGNYFRLDINSCDPPLSPQTGGSPSLTASQRSPSLTADPKDISIAEVPEENDLLQDSLWDGMYFGDEEPNLLADRHRTLLSNLPCSPDEPAPPTTDSRLDSSSLDTIGDVADPRPHPQSQHATELDMVVMVNEVDGSLVYSSCSGGGVDASGSSSMDLGTDIGGGVEGVAGNEEDATSRQAVNPVESSIRIDRVDTPTQPAALPRGTEESIAVEEEEEEEEEEGSGQERGGDRKGYRKRKRMLQVYDSNTELPAEEMKEWMEDVVMATREVDYTVQLRRATKAKDLFSQPFSYTVRHHVLAELGRASISEYEGPPTSRLEGSVVNNPHITDVGEQNTDINLIADVGVVDAAVSCSRGATPIFGEATPLITRGQVTPTSTPIHGREEANYKQPEGLLLSAIRIPPRDESSNLEREVARVGGHSRDMLLYEDPLSLLHGSSVPYLSASASHMTTSSDFTNSRNVISATRLQQEFPLGIVEHRSESLVARVLSPIADEDEGCDDASSLDLPPLDDSDHNRSGDPINRSGDPINTSSSSSSSTSIEEFCTHVAGVMGSRTHLEFQELLPPSCTKKMASTAFSRILTLISSQQFLTAEQSEPYGPIILHRGDRY